MAQYIHELPDWPNFEWDASIASELDEVVRRYDALVLRIDDPPTAEREEAAITFLTNDVVGSSFIKGEILDRDKVRSSITARFGSSSVQPDTKIEGAVEVTLDARERCWEPLATERLWNWHSTLFDSNSTNIEIGQWRTGPVHLVSGRIGQERTHFTAPAPERVAHEMDEFFDWFNAPDYPDLHPFVKAAVAHLWFMNI